MSATYIPYSQTAPQTDDLTILRTELDRCRETYGRRSSQALEAYLRYSSTAFRLGRPLDRLRRNSPHEAERFFALTIPGPDGHVYWDGPVNFTRNDGKHRSPIRWWWEHVHGTLRRGDQVSPICNDRHCICIDHAVREERGDRHRLYTDDQMIGALQVVAMRLGYAPSEAEWQRGGCKPSPRLYQRRFGSWSAARVAAGLTPTPKPNSARPRDCIRSLQAARQLLGHWPGFEEFRHDQRLKAHLRELGLPVNHHTIYKHLGATWDACLRKAGKR